MSTPRSQRGSVQVVLGLLALLLIVSSGMSAMVDKNQRFRRIEANTELLVAQANQIRTAINICVTMFPAGNNGTSYHVRYPAGSPTVNVSALTCPGNPATNKSIFQGQNGGYLDPVPDGYAAWAYTNNASGIYIAITSDGSPDDNIPLSRVAKRFSSASVSGNTLTLWILQG